MSSPRDAADLSTFEALRPELIALAYRMLGDVGRAQELVQDAWLRWHGRHGEVDSPRAYLLSIVARLCLTELSSARVRHERHLTRLPEPVDLALTGMERLERETDISMAFLVLLERLSPAERAVLLLHDVYELSHRDIAERLGRSVAGCRKLLERARAHVTRERGAFVAPPEAHQRLLQTFLEAVQSGDAEQVISLLAEDAVLLSDAGTSGVTVGSLRNLDAPLEGKVRIGHFVVAAMTQAQLEVRLQSLNGAPGVLFFRDRHPFAAMSLAVGDGRIRRIFFHADVQRLHFAFGPGRD